MQVNQIGTVTESIEAVKLSKQNGWGVMTSHRSGETEDSYIADLAVRIHIYNDKMDMHMHTCDPHIAQEDWYIADLAVPYHTAHSQRHTHPRHT